jgi:hypothetical protein
VSSNPNNALRGAGILLIGVPVYLLWRRRGKMGSRDDTMQGNRA